MIRHRQVKACHLRPQILKHVEIIKISENLHMVHHWRSLDLEITDFNYRHDPTQSGETIPSQISNLTHVEIMNVSNKPTQDTSLERF